MQDKLLYEYAVIRVVPRVEKEEFINAGIILFLHRSKTLLIKVCLKEEKIKVLCRDTDIPLLLQHLDSFVQIANGENKQSPIALLDAASRFRWLTAKRSTIIQSSQIHTGFCRDGWAELDRLCEVYIGA